MTKPKARTAKLPKSRSRSLLDRAIADLERELTNSRKPQGTSGQLDSPLLVAIANLTVEYVRWRVQKTERQP